MGPLVVALDKFWELMTGPDGSRRESVDYKAYLKSHVRTSKTLTSNSDLEDFDEDEERAVAQSDWSEDCARYGLKVTESLDKAQYYNAMYQLVGLWSGEQQLSYATFLRWIFENISEEVDDGRGGRYYGFRRMNAVEAVGDKFEKMREEARTAEEAQKAEVAEVLAAAEEARRLHVEQQRLLQEQREEEARQAKLRALDEERLLRETDQNAAERAELLRKLTELDDEEAELLRRLSSGELSPEEEAAVRARLEAIKFERLGLQAALADNQFRSELATLQKQLAGLDTEEAELLRRLKEGNLTPQEEAEIRERLATIASTREGLLQQKAAFLAGQGKAAADAVDERFGMELAAIDRQLSLLDNEEAELLRRLAAGDLTPEEEAAVRARLEVIKAQRESLLVQRYGICVARAGAQAAYEQTRMSAELAELQRRLASDLNLSEEERALFSEEESVRLRYLIVEADFAQQLAEISSRLASLNLEGQELRRRLASGELSAEEEDSVKKRLEEIEVQLKNARIAQMRVYKAEEAALHQLLKGPALAEGVKTLVLDRLKALFALMQSQKESTALEQLQDEGDRYELYLPIGRFEMKDSNRLSAEEIRVLKLQEQTNRRRRRELEMTAAAASGRVSTPELIQGGAKRAHERQHIASRAAAVAAREQQWVEFDASLLTPQQLAEWNHLRSTLRIQGPYGKGRALAWLGKVMRQMNLAEGHRVTSMSPRSTGLPFPITRRPESSSEFMVPSVPVMRHGSLPPVDAVSLPAAHKKAKRRKRQAKRSQPGTGAISAPPVLPGPPLRSVSMSGAPAGGTLPPKVMRSFKVRAAAGSSITGLDRPVTAADQIERRSIDQSSFGGVGLRRSVAIRRSRLMM